MTKHLWTYFSLTSPGDTSCLAQIENQSCQFTPLYVRYPVSAVRCPPLSCQLNACNINTIYNVYIYIAYRQSRAVSQLQLLIILHFLISTNPRSSSFPPTLSPCPPQMRLSAAPVSSASSGPPWRRLCPYRVVSTQIRPKSTSSGHSRAAANTSRCHLDTMPPYRIQQ